MQRIGIGVTTYNRPGCLAMWKYSIARHTFMNNVLIYVAEDTDSDRKGVAYRKNECLRALQDCDHIFLFDDDCYPIKDGWVENFISSGENHLLFLNETHRKISQDDSKAWYHDCGGVFMYFKRDCLDKVGAFNEKFSIWGFEHAEYSNRIHLKGLTKHNYQSLLNTSEFIYSCDYSNPYHNSSIGTEEKIHYFKQNFELYKEPIKELYLPL